MRVLTVCGIALTIAMISAPALATTGGLDTPQGIATLPFAVSGTEVMDMNTSGINFVAPNATVNGLTTMNLVTLNATGSVNSSSIMTVSNAADSTQTLTGDYNQLWTTGAGSTLYLQWSNSTGAVIVGSQTATSLNNLAVFGGVITMRALNNFYGGGGDGLLYGGSPQIFANGDNHWGGGIAISDDGGFYDYNDGWITYNGSNGVHIAGKSATNGTAITPNTAAAASLVVDGRLSTDGFNPMDIPTGWAGGIRTYDVYASGTVGVGTGGGANPTSYMNNNGIYTTGVIQPGSSANVTDCSMGSGSGEGGERYNYTTHTMEYCNGTGWVAMGGMFTTPSIVYSHNGTVYANSTGSPLFLSVVCVPTSGWGGINPGSMTASYWIYPPGGGAGTQVSYGAESLAFSKGEGGTLDNSPSAIVPPGWSWSLTDQVGQPGHPKWDQCYTVAIGATSYSPSGQNPPI
jgi:hypothetical protein